MSDHTTVLTVVLDKDYRVDDAKSIIEAISMIKGVLTASATVSNVDTYVAYSRARLDLENKLWSVLKDDSKC